MKQSQVNTGDSSENTPTVDEPLPMPRSKQTSSETKLSLIHQKIDLDENRLSGFCFINVKLLIEFVS